MARELLLRIRLADIRPVPSVGRVEARVRRALNVAVAVIGIAVTLPLMLLIAAAIKLTSRGPVLFRQTRVGLDRRRPGALSGNTRRHVEYGGTPFTIYKFRTMYEDRTRTGEQVWALPDDKRVTPVGRVLRRFRLDELPQLLNVLRGEMNVVGPRPEQPNLALSLRELVDGYQLRQAVLPGITGLAQTRLSYDRTLEDVRRKVRLDLEYIERQSALEDLKIMLRTLPVMLRARNGW
ncbi:MAG: sugar transferase [Gemmatimonadetes bacterium]|nr:sugar transferase [Gemmatimonadota bacterium]